MDYCYVHGWVYGKSEWRKNEPEPVTICPLCEETEKIDQHNPHNREKEQRRWLVSQENIGGKSGCMEPQA